MHRTITSAALLITAATSTLTACVTVSPPAGPRGGAEPKTVQAPVREALDDLRHSRPRPARTHRPEPSRPAPRSKAGTRPAQPLVPLPRLPAVPQAPVGPALPRPAQPQRPDACSLGRDFDQWQSDDDKVHLC